MSQLGDGKKYFFKDGPSTTLYFICSNRINHKDVITEDGGNDKSSFPIRYCN